VEVGRRSVTPAGLYPSAHLPPAPLPAYGAAGAGVAASPAASPARQDRLSLRGILESRGGGGGGGGGGGAGEAEEVSMVLEGLRALHPSAAVVAGGGGAGRAAGGAPADDAGLWVRGGAVLPLFPTLRDLQPCDPEARSEATPFYAEALFAPPEDGPCPAAAPAAAAACVRACRR